jgi:excisionase family DNA binding protein
MTPTNQTHSRAELFSDGVLQVAAAVEFCGLGRTQLYSLMSAGKLPYSQVGTRRLIPRRALVDLLAEKAIGVERA